MFQESWFDSWWWKNDNSRKNSNDSDSNYADADNNTTCTDITSVITKKSNTKSSKAFENDNTDNDNLTADFSLEINTNVSSGPDYIVDFDDSTMTIAEIIKISCKEINNTKDESLNQKKSIGKKMRDALVETANDEVLKVFTLPKHWIYLIPSFRIRETSTNIKESAIQTHHLLDYHHWQ